MRTLLLLGLTTLLASCASEADLFEDAPNDRATVVVVVKVTGDRATLVASEGALADLDRIPGVLKVRRGSGQNEVWCLVDGRVDPYSLVGHLAPTYRVTVLRVVKKSDVD
jgi:hypothetical protein